MSATITEHTPLEVLLNDPIMKSFDLVFVKKCRAQFAELNGQIAWLTTTIGEDGLAAINRLIAACERGDIHQIAAPDLSIARDEILEGREAVEQARIARDELYMLIDQHVSVTDEWGGSKLANWKWGNNVCVDGIDDAVDAIMLRLAAHPA